MTAAGWREGSDPPFTIVPGMARKVLYALRLVTGVLMLLASMNWFVDASTQLHESVSRSNAVLQEKTA